ncbi:NAD(P)-dependent alcohol dehydrogenase [Cohnella hashimotonis]|uniref:NAD(P)-dependent alcohol dehydrogenase n=1 Tax=Cohnella hashimotonis TaxID=2826895 RepID=A0ABT6TAH1_9BACL|nr:NAD(P)-dependent alcohol dehydrogenase [Cohnella hashimotonis]MDI4643826.1 NAD(P)-dependent alcohol dehydrogenase [Cohnella hashimotonis]
MDNKTMNAAVMKEKGRIEVERIDRPSPGPDEALIKVACIGICGSDIHYYEHGRIGRYVVDGPLILGHEVAGTVVEIGERVANLKVGDRVAIEPGIPCGRCEYCKGGRYNLCPDVFFLATPPDDGAWADYIAMRADVLFPLPDSMSFEEGALLEPLSVGYHAMNRANVKPSDRLFITGLGPIGLLAIQAAKLFGVREIYASDVVAFRREYALKLGATAVFDPLSDSIAAELANRTGGEGVDVIVESSGNHGSIASTVSLAKRGGRIVFVGLPPENGVSLNVDKIIDSELNIYGVFRYANTYKAAIQAYAGSGLDIAEVITHSFGLKDINEALHAARTQKDKAIKIMIYPGAEQEA